MLHVQFFGESQFYDASFQLGFLPKCAGLQEIRFRASVWNSAFQRAHIQFFGESQFYNGYFPIVTSAEIGRLTENHIWACVWDFGGFNIRTYKIAVNLSFI